MKLRIPLILFIMGLVSGIVQLFQSNFTMTKFSSGVMTVLYFALIAVAIITFEKTGISEKKIHILAALFFVLIGILFDLLTI